MACAFGMEACKQYYNTRYVRMPDLLMDLDIACSEGNYRKAMAKYSNFFIEDVRNHQLSSVHIMYSKNGMISSVVRTVRWLMQSLIELPMTAIRSTSQALMQNMTDPFPA